MSLRGEPLEADVPIPDGTIVHIRIGVPEDPYLPKRELDTVTVELSANGEHIAAVTSVLDPDQTSEARTLLHGIVSRLGSGELPPTAGAIERLTETLL